MNKVNKRGPFIHDWSNFNPEPKEVHPLLKRSDHRINLSNSNRRRAKDLKIREKIKQKVSEYYKKNPTAKKKHSKGLVAYNKDPKKAKERSERAKRTESNRSQEHKDKIIAINQSFERRKKVSKGLRKAIGRTIITPFGEFNCAADFHEDLKVKKILEKDVSFPDKNRLLPHLYYWKDTGPGKVITQKVYYSPYGVWYKTSGMWAKAKAKGCIEANRNIDPNNTYVWFIKMMKKEPKKYYIKLEPKREWAFFPNP